MKAPQPNTPPATQKVKVLRSFTNHERKVLEKNTETTLPLAFAREMKAANKVEFVVEDPAAAQTPATSPRTEQSVASSALAGRKER